MMCCEIRRDRCPATILVLLGAIALSTTARPAAAIIVRNQQTNNTAPTGDQGFSYVGHFGTNGVPNSGVYLGYINGSNWALTAYHNLSTSAFHVGSQTLSYIESQRIGGGTTDLRLVKLGGGSIGLSPLTIRSTAITNGTAVTMVGNGVVAATGEIDLDPNLGPPLLGYDWTAITTRPKLWGTNTTIAIDPNQGGTMSFATLFNNNAGLNEATFADKDSGSGVFINNAGGWELAGVAFGIYQVPSDARLPKDAGTNNLYSNSVYGDASYMVDLSYYRNDIIAAIPEPTSMLLMTLGAAALATRRRRRV